MMASIERTPDFGDDDMLEELPEWDEESPEDLADLENLVDPTDEEWN
jgi:hypothetical protein